MEDEVGEEVGADEVASGSEHRPEPDFAAISKSTTSLRDSYRGKLKAQRKLYVRERLALLLDEGSFVEDGLLANAVAGDLPADGVVTGVVRSTADECASWPMTQL